MRCRCAIWFCVASVTSLCGSVLHGAHGKHACGNAGVAGEQDEWRFPRRMPHNDKRVPQECPTQVSHESAQKCTTRVFSQLSPTCQARVPHKSVLQELPPGVSLKNAPQGGLTRVSHKSVPQVCLARVFHKGFPQECPTTLA